METRTVERKQVVVVGDGPSRWIVHSDSGTTYHVRFRTKLDEAGCLYFTWQCDCPAGRYGKICRHIQSVEQQTEPVDDQAAERVA